MHPQNYFPKIIFQNKKHFTYNSLVIAFDLTFDHFPHLQSELLIVIGQQIQSGFSIAVLSFSVDIVLQQDFNHGDSVPSNRVMETSCSVFRLQNGDISGLPDTEFFDAGNPTVGEFLRIQTFLKKADGTAALHWKKTKSEPHFCVDIKTIFQQQIHDLGMTVVSCDM